ncbi:hypothetical protein [Azohydromonas australica]|uniref:hypothetical protein n=1 Tax=Azohydromonas australica TaxID=364039 RepID=UPI0012EC91F9|nr:hypothetical protein [Azohydromonas australica]
MDEQPHIKLAMASVKHDINAVIFMGSCTAEQDRHTGRGQPRALLLDASSTLHRNSHGDPEQRGGWIDRRRDDQQPDRRSLPRVLMIVFRRRRGASRTLPC